MPRLLCVGHSHITALRLAWAQQGGGDACAFLCVNEPQYQPVLREGRLHPEIQARLGAAALHVSLFVGNDHSIIGMLNHPRRFDFVLPEAPALFVDESAELLPAGLLRRELARRVAPHLEALAAYRAAVPGLLVHVESPPPIPSAAHIQAHPGVFKDLIAERGVSPALLRFKLWRLHSGLYREACAALGVEFLPVPPEMQDVEGMLVPQAWNPDPTHGNALYGQHVLARLMA
ncbi:hypothetical protein [Acidocella sp. KAb 2-4]|uniref:hypothetical protein n=1 Tax=Acidocella sp. KAb 2-4 TaxID=2885158 RepID=UPI001D077887|nr:hypothetical protein [Acidocella sp. KAb 2-4]MCB5944008.1 hypothetical protein [Acidocella sp. KAb 2-4]